ncbi:hypothetical protein HMPREF0653_01700 [Prevotella disiens JCM 6334 = ATCC 29426]|uniref:Uncharacterized protein n=1 Tax=Prevotella disiens JCM 6334 = ATCC 29426 TaxID=1235811 RepID=A0ABP2Y6R9_9BACT|nr:hypothetical protein HMPREF0653_01700 [Prevotella disiens JCM 6334 = ATCC 29426]
MAKYFTINFYNKFMRFLYKISHFAYKIIITPFFLARKIK